MLKDDQLQTAVLRELGITTWRMSDASLLDAAIVKKTEQKKCARKIGAKE